ncbi:MAG: DedA family protein [Calditrichaeota bacterium]|nr:MAG: DedA family protein [Calditrichota bacterium]
MVDSLPQINEWLDVIFQYGTIWVYIVLFAACFIENIFPPFPGDTFILAAGVLVGLDRLDLVYSLLCIIAGGVNSVLLIYLFGKNKGYNFFKRKNYKIFSSEDIEKSRIYFSKYGAFILIFSRFVVGFRSALALVAGISRYSQILMIVYSTISYLIFCGLIYYVAIALVDNFDTLSKYIRTYNWIVFLVLIIFMLLFILNKFRSKKG